MCQIHYTWKPWLERMVPWLMCFESPTITESPRLVVRNFFFLLSSREESNKLTGLVLFLYWYVFVAVLITGNPLSKDYLGSIDKGLFVFGIGLLVWDSHLHFIDETGLLSSVYPEAKEVLRLNSMGTYWLGCRNRVLSQFVVWNDNSLIGDFGKETEWVGEIRGHPNFFLSFSHCNKPQRNQDWCHHSACENCRNCHPPRYWAHMDDCEVRLLFFERDLQSSLTFPRFLFFFFCLPFSAIPRRPWMDPNWRLKFAALQGTTLLVRMWTVRSFGFLPSLVTVTWKFKEALVRLLWDYLLSFHLLEMALIFFLLH